MDAARIRSLRIGLGVCLALYAAAHLAGLLAQSGRHQWDLRVYYTAGRAWLAGDNPYSVADLNRQGTFSIRLPFLLLPAALPACAALSMLPWRVAYYLWLTIGLGCAGYLLWLWRRLLPRVDPLLLAGVAVLGFGGAMIVALRSGNPVLIAQALLWTGFVFFMRGRPWVFALLMVPVGLLKPPEFLFAGLLLVSPGDRRHNLGALAVALVLMLALGLGPLLARPDWTAGFADGAGLWREGGRSTPCARALIDNAWHRFAQPRGLPDQGRDWLWLAWCLGLLAVSYRSIRGALASGDRSHLLMVAIIIYSLLTPRFKSYTYMMLVVPTLMLYLPVLSRVRGELVYVVLAVLPGLLTYPAGLIRLMVCYHPFLANLLLWLGYVFLTTSSGPDRSRPSPGGGETQGAAEGSEGGGAAPARASRESPARTRD